MTRFFFPCLHSIPRFEPVSLDLGPVAVHRRLWETSVFDLATLATRHTLHIPYQLMDVFLGSCNLEIEIRDMPDASSALKRMQVLRFLMYVHGSSPFIVPFVTSHSINSYSGINSRESPLLRDRLPDGLKEGLTSEAGSLEVWPADMALQIIRAAGTAEISLESISAAVKDLSVWESLESECRRLNVPRQAILNAPCIADLGSSMLHIWQGIESLFPSISSEVSFRLGLLIAELCRPVSEPAAMFRKVRNSYAARSKVTHGSSERIGPESWASAWDLLKDCLRSVLIRGGLPSEEALLVELLGGSGMKEQTKVEAV